MPKTLTSRNGQNACIDILDASALLAFLKKENGYLVVQKMFKNALQQKNSVFIHQVNFIEVTRKILKLYGEGESKKILASLHQPFLGISNYMDDRQASYTSWIYLSANISLGDSIGLAFTKIMGGTFWTADKALQEIAKKENIRLRLIRD